MHSKNGACTGGGGGNFISTFTKLHVHGDERWPMEMMSKYVFSLTNGSDVKYVFPLCRPIRGCMSFTDLSEIGDLPSSCHFKDNKAVSSYWVCCDFSAEEVHCTFRFQKVTSMKSRICATLWWTRTGGCPHSRCNFNCLRGCYQLSRSSEVRGVSLCFNSQLWKSIQPTFNPFTPKSDQFQISPAASP